MHGFPLTAGPQDVPDAIDNRAGIGPRASRATARNRFGQQALDFAPEWARNAKVIDIGWFCARIPHGVAFLTMRINTTYCQSATSLCPILLNLRIDTKEKITNVSVHYRADRV